MPMSNQPGVPTDMADAERNIQKAMTGKLPGEAMLALLKLYQGTPESKREALVAVLATRVAVGARTGSY
jgi:hypothetical protein